MCVCVCVNVYTDKMQNKLCLYAKCNLCTEKTEKNCTHIYVLADNEKNEWHNATTAHTTQKKRPKTNRSHARTKTDKIVCVCVRINSAKTFILAESVSGLHFFRIYIWYILGGCVFLSRYIYKSFKLFFHFRLRISTNILDTATNSWFCFVITIQARQMEKKLHRETWT